MLDQPEKTKANGRSPASGKSTAASRPAARGRKRAARPDESQHPEGNVSDSNPFSPDGHSKSLGDAKDEEENPDDDEGVDDDDDSTCAICGSPKCTRKNSIVFCDGEGCDVPVHQKCYDVKELPPEEEKWFCQRCEDGVVVESTRVLCCPLTTGALKRTDQSGGYVHVNCGLWNPAISTNNPQKWTVGLDEIHREPCTLCSVAEGYTIRCVYDDDEADTEDAGCDHFFHVTCAIESGLITVTSPPYFDGYRRPQKRKLVRKTSSASVDLDPIAGSPRKRGRAILHDEDDEDEDDNDGVSDDDERFQEKGTPSPSFKHKKPTPKDEVPLPDRPQSPRESDSAIIAESAKLAPGNSPSPTPPPRPPPASDTVKTGPTDNALPIPESASLLSKAPISGPDHPTSSHGF
ncbi:hypothetical protein BJ085DRAFT_33111 [Dimargaris cristalligena]|uniref:PHD-type domain-containing protein n=1 Tax=Dimargaris cristalligena TaxID=215637 RepID=A0A4P9ZJH7_9FUNG|nr:hypothetical protein BJ085DRAFT_33111 [Dimargaris cristalligena]|eukprot:RKP33188.1 hypothetical protein BJ085DRAFT_33111 [Dimargaris cristalligena]